MDHNQEHFVFGKASQTAVVFVVVKRWLFADRKAAASDDEKRILNTSGEEVKLVKIAISER